MTCVFLDSKKIMWVHLGDCRIYQFRKRKIRILTKEHHDEEGRLLKAIGVGQWQLPDVGQRNVKKGDKFLVCTDGLYKKLHKDELRRWAMRGIADDGQANRMLRQLLEKKRNLSEKDNISALYFGSVTKEKNREKK